MSSHIITPGPYRATKLWNEVTRLFRSGMPLGKHRHAFRTHASCFTATAAVNWLHQLLCSNSNFGPDVTRQQTVQLLKKFLKNHVIEDVKGRWGTEDLEDNNTLYRFPSSSPLKSIPSPAQTAASGSLKRSLSIIDKEGFFRIRSLRKNDKETQENVDPAFQTQAVEDSQPMEGQQQQRQELTEETEHEVWKHVTLTHLQKILGLASLDDVLDPRHVNPQNIIHNMTRVNKHGVVSLEDKTNDLPHWVLNAMKSLANWPKYDSGQPSYPGFERDVFKTVSDYFYSLPQPLLTYQLYELFINVLALCGYVTPAPPPRHGKRKLAEPPSRPPPTKASFRSTECLLLSLLRQGSCDEADSPMKEVFSARVHSQLAALKGGTARLRRQHGGGSCLSLSQPEGAAAPGRLRPRSCSLETVLGDSAPLFLQQQLFPSGAGPAAASPRVTGLSDTSSGAAFTTPSPGETAPRGGAAKRHSAPPPSATRRPCLLRPQSVGSCLDVARETARESRATSHPPPSHPTVAHGRDDDDDDDDEDEDALRGPQAASAASSVPAIPRRWLSSLELFKPPVCLLPSAPRPPQRTQSLLQPQCERVAVEALQLCTLLLPPASRRKLQLLMRMMSRIGQNVDMPRLHHAIGTRTLMVHTFSGCVLGSAEGCDLDELLSTRLVSFLMDHQDSILSVPKYLLSAVTDHVHYLRAAQLPVSLVCDVSVPVTSHAFCRQISNTEFEEQKVLSSQKAMEELLEILLTNQNISEKERRKKLKQFQKQYPDIYNRRFPAAEGEMKQRSKPKIKPPLLNIKKTKANQSSIRN